MSSRFPLLEGVPSMQALMEDPQYERVRAELGAHPDYQVRRVAFSAVPVFLFFSSFFFFLFFLLFFRRPPHRPHRVHGPVPVLPVFFGLSLDDDQAYGPVARIRFR